MQDQIEEGFMAFIAGQSTGIGAVRQVAPDGRAEIVIYVENAGDFVVPFDPPPDWYSVISRLRSGYGPLWTGLQTRSV